jgi:hypothetical protein
MIETSQNIAARVEASFPFRVEKFPLAGPDNMPTDLYGLWRVGADGMEHVGNAVKRGYEPHQTDDVVALVEAASQVFGESNLRCSWRQGHHVIIEPTQDQRRAIYGTDDCIFPRVYISAGYGGKPFSGSLGFYRDACRNLAMLRSVSSVSFSVKHTNKLRRCMGELVDSFGRIAESWPAVVAAAQQMERQRCSIESFLGQIYGLPEGASDRTAGNYEKKINRIISRIAKERLKLGRDMGDDTDTASGWELFNAVQGYEQHDARRKGQPSDMDRIVQTMQTGSAANRIALAERLALSV